MALRRTETWDNGPAMDGLLVVASAGEPNARASDTRGARVGRVLRRAIVLIGALAASLMTLFWTGLAPTR